MYTALERQMRLASDRGRRLAGICASQVRPAQGAARKRQAACGRLRQVRLVRGQALCIQYAAVFSEFECVGERVELLQQHIRDFGSVKTSDILKVDSFLNHQIDIRLLDALGAEFKRLFADAPITKILTIEASGIAIAAMAARHFDVPVLFAKKSRTSNLDASVLTTKVASFTHGCEYDVIVSKRFLTPDDHVLIIDDFLANGCAIEGLIDLVQQAGATVEGIGIAIEKGFQPGGARLRERGLRLESLAIVERMDAETGEIDFR